MTQHRAGVVETPSGPSVAVRTWTDGRAWLKLGVTREWPGGRLFGDVGGPVRAVDLGAAGVAYVGDGAPRGRPAGGGEAPAAAGRGRGGGTAVRKVASALGVQGESVPPGWPEAGTATRAQAATALPNLVTPRKLGGFSEPAIRIDGDVVTFAYAGAGSRGFE